MKTVKIGEQVADLELPATGGKKIKLSELKDRKVVLYFYPRDNTSGCTLEAQNFQKSKRAFSTHKAVILGVSSDTLQSHENFKKKQSLTFTLISDVDQKLCNQFGVIKEKNMYGRKFKGIERSTFLIDEQGHLIKEWRAVKVKGHVDEVLEAVKNS